MAYWGWVGGAEAQRAFEWSFLPADIQCTSFSILAHP